MKTEDSNNEKNIYIDSDDAFFSNSTILEMFNCIKKTDQSISSVIFSSVDVNDNPQSPCLLYTSDAADE